MNRDERSLGRSRFSAPTAGAVALALAAVTVGACAAGEESSDAGTALAAEAPGLMSTAASTRAPVQLPAGLEESRATAIVRASNRVSPSVVTVNVARTQRVAPRTYFESFFPSARRAIGFGSGFIITEDGIILTNEHVIRNADRIMVTLSDGRDLPAELVGFDEVVDVAVLKIDASGLPVAPTGAADDLIIGEWVIAIGNPFGTAVSNAEPTVTAGVVSAVGRHIVPSGEDEGFYLGMIQTDAAINPGNSGGPLVNALGDVVGVNSSIFSRSGGSEGLGFAIPIDRALRVADDLLRYGAVRRAWLGFDVEPVSEVDEWGRTRGVRVSNVAAGSVADQAGIQSGVRLLTANGRRLTTPLDFEAVMLDLRADDPITLELEGINRPLDLVAATLPSMRADRVTALGDLDVITVTPEIRAERGLRTQSGAMIVDIPAELQQELGFRDGDVIVGVNRTVIRTADELAQYFQDLRGRGRLRITFERNNDYVFRDFAWGG